MQFGIFTIGDLTTDPISGKTPNEAERIRNLTEIALKAEEVGLDVFATGDTTTHLSCRPLLQRTWLISPRRRSACIYLLPPR